MHAKSVFLEFLETVLSIMVIARDIFLCVTNVLHLYVLVSTVPLFAYVYVCALGSIRPAAYTWLRITWPEKGGAVICILSNCPIALPKRGFILSCLNWVGHDPFWIQFFFCHFLPYTKFGLVLFSFGELSCRWTVDRVWSQHKFSYPYLCALNMQLWATWPIQGRLDMLWEHNMLGLLQTGPPRNMTDSSDGDYSKWLVYPSALWCSSLFPGDHIKRTFLADKDGVYTSH